VIRDPGSSPEAERLGRELRGTIEELLQARRTIDLQRQELERASSVDPLTGVSSRAAIIARLRLEVAQSRRYQHPVAVVLLDVDDFGAVNRAHGTAGGDSALREVALRIRLRVREADELGRFGSDAFLAVLPHTDEGGASTFADALQHRLGLRPITVGSEQIELTASVGIAVIRPGDDLDIDGLLARADEALASARRAGGNRIALDRAHGPARLEDHNRATRDDPSDDTGAV
jgi:diguanylate cyclase (GGDEF)-like protein